MVPGEGAERDWNTLGGWSLERERRGTGTPSVDGPWRGSGEGLEHPRWMVPGEGAERDCERAGCRECGEELGRLPGGHAENGQHLGSRCDDGEMEGGHGENGQHFSSRRKDEEMEMEVGMGMGVEVEALACFLWEARRDEEKRKRSVKERDQRQQVAEDGGSEERRRENSKREESEERRRENSKREESEEGEESEERRRENSKREESEERRRENSKREENEEGEKGGVSHEEKREEEKKEDKNGGGEEVKTAKKDKEREDEERGGMREREGEDIKEKDGESEDKDTIEKEGKREGEEDRERKGNGEREEEDTKVKEAEREGEEERESKAGREREEEDTKEKEGEREGEEERERKAETEGEEKRKKKAEREGEDITEKKGESEREEERERKAEREGEDNAEREREGEEDRESVQEVWGWAECPECKSEPLFFCVDDGQPLCYECGGSDIHRGHTLRPHEAALQDCREEMHICMQPLFQGLKTLTKMQQTCRQMAKHIPTQSQQTEGQIRKEFEALRRFLRAEEEARVAAVREELQRKAGVQREAAERLRKETRQILHALHAAHTDMRTQGDDGLHFLQNYKTTVKRVWSANQNPRKEYDSLINVPKHVGNLRFRVWEKMQNICPYTPVTLDPNTAGPFLHVSDDLTRVRDSGFDTESDAATADADGGRLPPDNPERFSSCGEMLGHEVISCSGSQQQPPQHLPDRGDGHRSNGCTSWVVDVGDNSNWMVGVARRSVSRNSLTAACPDNGCWAVSLRRSRYEALEAPAVALPLFPVVHSAVAAGNRGPAARGAPGPRRVKVRVSRGTGRVCFTDADRHTHLYTFSSSSSSSDEVLQPYFATSCQHCPLTVLPATVTVTTSLPGPGGRQEGEDEEEEEEEEEEDKKEEEQEEEKQRQTDEGQKTLTQLSVKKRHSVLDYLTIPESQQQHLSHTDL
ncbi:hypothetical protein ACEWY4_017410 [Coilia grayii]|uniref:B box-type domain-containing protein n=1 Tax=Coilia grayii TaxID=363190 RepID=A0ABD1JGQ9_9TELE